MIGLVFGFFFAVIVLWICVSVLAFLFNTGLIWWLLGGILVLVLLALTLVGRETTQPVHKNYLQQACLDKVQSDAIRLSTRYDQATIQRGVLVASSNCRQQYP